MFRAATSSNRPTSSGSPTRLKFGPEPFKTEPFNEFPDYSKHNARCHQATRLNTFHTPSNMENKKASEKSTGDTAKETRDSELLWICEQGIGRTVRNLRKEIHQDLQEYTVGLVREELGKHIAPLGEQLQDLQMEVNNLDMASFRESLVKKISATTATAQEMSDVAGLVKLLPDIAEGVRYLQDEQRAGSSRLESLEMRMQSTEDSRRRSEEMLDRLSQSSAASSARTTETSEQVKTLLQHSVDGLSQLCLQEQANRHMDSRIGLFEKTIGQVKLQMESSMRTVHNDFVFVVNEIGNVQKALNVDFVQILTHIEEEVKSVEKETAELGRKFTEADELKNAPPAIEDTPPLQAIEARSQEKTRSTGAAARWGMLSGLSKGCRRRDFFCQTDAAEVNDVFCQTDDSLLPKDGKKKRKKTATPKSKTKPKSAQEKNVFRDEQAEKKKVRKKMIQPQYNVFDYYKATGPVQWIAKHPMFENVTMLVIILNTIWISIDTDLNDETILYMAEPVFQVFEHFFCSYFFIELFIRFCAFRRTFYALTDAWFVFDFVLVFTMVLETWVFTIIVAASQSPGSAGFGTAVVLRIGRMARILRVSRVARLLKVLPELVVLVKGILFAVRSVFVFAVFWLLIIYVFALLFRNLTDPYSPLGEKYFYSVLDSMNTLLLRGLIPDMATMVEDISAANPWLYPLILVFILMASMTVMYMLIGVLVEVVSIISGTEREKALVLSVAGNMRDVLTEMGVDCEAPLSKYTVKNMMGEMNFLRILDSQDVDSVMLGEMLDIQCELYEKAGEEFTFEKLIDAVLNMRGANHTTVRDMKEHLWLLQREFSTNTKIVMSRLDGVNKTVNEQLLEVRQLLMDAVQDKEGSGSEDEGEDDDDDGGDDEN